MSLTPSPETPLPINGEFYLAGFNQLFTVHHLTVRGDTSGVVWQIMAYLCTTTVSIATLSTHKLVRVF